MAEKEKGLADFRGWRFPEDPDSIFEDEKNGFKDTGGFVGTVFASFANFDGATFSGDASFDGATFSGVASFGGATFSKWARFDGATFSGETVFDGAVCNPGATARFDHPVRRCILGRPHPFRRRREGETAYRFAKQSAQGAGDYSQAGSYHYAEQCAIEDKWRNKSGLRPWRKAFWWWLGRLVFGRIVFGYGERPLHPLLLGLGVIVIWTALYAGYAAIAPGNQAATVIEAYRPSVGEAAHFSIVTFTTLGYGDFQPKPPYRLLADAEAMLGATLMAVFVVCLTRKYMR